MSGGWRKSMASSMKERNDKEAWDAYMAEGKRLMEETMRQAEALEEKYKDEPRNAGIDGDPEMKERREITRRFGQEVKRLQEKYGIK